MVTMPWRGLRGPDRCKRLTRVRATGAVGGDCVHEHRPVQPRLDADHGGTMTAHDLHRAAAV
jgi:hypothetical protein